MNSTKCSLHRWHIHDRCQCKLCLAMDEHLMHICIDSLFTRQTLLGWSSEVVCLPRLHLLTWSRDIVSAPMFYNGDRAQIVLIMWYIWHSRNRWTHEGEHVDPANSLQTIQENFAILELPQEHALTSREMASHNFCWWYTISNQRHHYFFQIVVAVCIFGPSPQIGPFS